MLLSVVEIIGNFFTMLLLQVIDNSSSMLLFRAITNISRMEFLQVISTNICSLPFLFSIISDILGKKCLESPV